MKTDIEATMKSMLFARRGARLAYVSIKEGGSPEWNIPIWERYMKEEREAREELLRLLDTPSSWPCDHDEMVAEMAQGEIFRFGYSIPVIHFYRHEPEIENDEYPF